MQFPFHLCLDAVVGINEGILEGPRGNLVEPYAEPNGTHTFSDWLAPPAFTQGSRGLKVFAPSSRGEPEMFLPLQLTCVLAAPTEGVLLPHLEQMLLSIPKAPSLLGLGLGQE